MQRLGLVAGPRLAQQALAKIQLESITNRRVSDDERERRRFRRVAIKHVLETGTIYNPIVERYHEPSWSDEEVTS
jgi:hypothetical protein